MKIIENDSWLSPHADVISRRHEQIMKKEMDLSENIGSMQAFASGYLYFGMHKSNKEWIIREWMPNATSVHLIGDFNNWELHDDYEFQRLDHGNWELRISEHRIKHLDRYKLHVKWKGGSGDRIPAWAKRTVQDDDTKIFNAQVWWPDNSYQWSNKQIDLNDFNPIIYEAHIGMASEEEKVASFTEFRENILPRVLKGGYNTIQLMAIQEHPYYGSFGYHVSNLFAVSSRFGTPDELKELIDEAHAKGIAVIMDIVHSHGVKNELEGLGNFAGDPGQFFHTGERRNHTAWDSLCYDYGKNEVLHFLLSNIKFWIDEYHFDGFRFDGVTSMIYYDHGLERSFSSYDMYFDGGQDEDAITYLALANKLIQQIKPGAISVAEDMSGYPGIASAIEEGGLGFTHRLAMGVPDFWIKCIKELPDEDWNMNQLFHELTSRRTDESVIGYAESHDQALVGDKTIIFRLIDKEMYWHMNLNSENLNVDRGIALHKMIRLITLSTAGGGYLNFMGNEFGHPEWIDFPREGNNWSYKYARRQWSLVDNPDLKFQFLNNFDQEIINHIRINNLLSLPLEVSKIDQDDKVIAFSRGEFLFVYNFHPTNSYNNYGLPVPAGKYKTIYTSDENRFGGFDRVDKQIFHRTSIERTFGLKQNLKLYLPARTTCVLQYIPIPKVR